MRKIILAVLLISATLSAKAWHLNCDKAVLLLASQNYNPQTLQLVHKYIGEDLTKPAQLFASLRKDGRYLETEGWQKLHLDANLRRRMRTMLMFRLRRPWRFFAIALTTIIRVCVLLSIL